MTVTGENQSAMLNPRILWPLASPVWQHLTRYPSLWGRPSSSLPTGRETGRLNQAEEDTATVSKRSLETLKTEQNQAEGLLFFQMCAKLILFLFYEKNLEN